MTHRALCLSSLIPLLLAPPAASAYIDPGASALFVTSFLASVAAAGWYLRSLCRRLWRRLLRRPPPPTPARGSQPPAEPPPPPS